MGTKMNQQSKPTLVEELQVDLEDFDEAMGLTISGSEHERCALLLFLTRMKRLSREAALQSLASQTQELDTGDGPNTCPNCGKSQAAAQVPEGWKLVPIALTTAMIDALIAVPDYDDSEEDVNAMWGAMVNAAPQPPAAIQPEPSKPSSAEIDERAEFIHFMSNCVGRNSPTRWDVWQARAALGKEK
jgi:hypothetical protein